jgi:hypothetical protein
VKSDIIDNSVEMCSFFHRHLNLMKKIWIVTNTAAATRGPIIIPKLPRIERFRAPSLSNRKNAATVLSIFAPERIGNHIIPFQ